MILSASRRTDIPAFYSEWFFERIRDGYFLVRNPMNAHQVSRVDISPELVDCIVFWTKSARPMLDRLDALSDYRYYFQHTLNGYGYEIEPHVPPFEERIATFEALSARLGRERVIWRYDPVFFTDRYTLEFHLECFAYLAGRLSGKTEKCVFSFVDLYPTKNLRNMRSVHMTDNGKAQQEQFAEAIARIAAENGIRLATCAERIDLSRLGIEHNRCIDPVLIERICGYRLNVKPDGQRPDCGCVRCEEMGAYDTCPHGCVYCYANFRSEAVAARCRRYDPHSPMLCDTLMSDDKLTVRKVRSLRIPGTQTAGAAEEVPFEQLRLF